MNDALSRLLELELSSGPLLILTHDNPDPDSLSSACALQHLLRVKRGIDSVVGYTGMVGRAENRAMLELLALDVVPITGTELAGFSHFALIDAQPHTGNSIFGDERTVDIVIDHHPLRPATLATRFHDVRSDVGASATVLTEYLRGAEVDVPTALATALLYGIRTETQDLGRETSDADRAAFHYLFPLADQSRLAAIAKPRLGRDYYQAVSDALSNVRTIEDVLVCFVGNVPDPDFVPEMADFFVRMNGASWALVQGKFGETLYLSIRTQQNAGGAGELMQRILTDEGSGGGHGMRAGGSVVLTNDRTAAQVAARVERRFVEILQRSQHPEAVIRTREERLS